MSPAMGGKVTKSAASLVLGTTTNCHMQTRILYAELRKELSRMLTEELLGVRK